MQPFNTALFHSAQVFRALFLLESLRKRWLVNLRKENSEPGGNLPYAQLHRRR